MLGAFGGVVKTPGHRDMLRMFSRVGILEERMETLLRRASFSIAMTTSKLLVRRCHAASSGERPKAGEAREE